MTFQSQTIVNYLHLIHVESSFVPNSPGDTGHACASVGYNPKSMLGIEIPHVCIFTRFLIRFPIGSLTSTKKKLSLDLYALILVTTNALYIPRNEQRSLFDILNRDGAALIAVSTQMNALSHY